VRADESQDLALLDRESTRLTARNPPNLLVRPATSSNLRTRRDR
jgi:hypothetical protein